MSYIPPPELLEILVDPETRGPLHFANKLELESVYQAIKDGKATRRDGKEIPDNFEGIFLAQEGTVGYAVIEGIPVFLIEERLEFSPPIEFGKKK